MVTLVIAVGIYAVECLGSNCFSISQGSFEAMLAVGVLEIVYEIPRVITIYRKNTKELRHGDK
jgi:hypothetical protein